MIVGVAADPLHQPALRDLHRQSARVSCYISDRLKVIDVATTTITGEVLGLDARPTSPSRGRSKLFAGNLDTGNLHIVDVATNTLLPTLTPGNSPTRRSRRMRTIAYVNNSSSHTVSLIDTATMALVDTINLAGDRTNRRRTASSWGRTSSRPPAPAGAGR